MDYLDFALIPSVILCAMVTGFIFTYAVVVMPGFSKLGDKEFIKAFQVTDAVIQNNQPLFMLTWIGSIISILSTIIVAIATTVLTDSWLIILVSVIYLLGVQGITIGIHLPLNNHIQNMDIDKMTDKDVENLADDGFLFSPAYSVPPIKINFLSKFIAITVSLRQLCFSGFA